jgi:hypothetical protein
VNPPFGQNAKQRRRHPVPAAYRLWHRLYGCRVCCVVVVVVDTAGRGTEVVVSRVVVVRIGSGPPHADSITIPASMAMPIAMLNRDFVWVII